ncbi:MAG: SRPBCC family protein [Gemmatimonadota bacterium]
MSWTYEHGWKLDTSTDKVFAALTDPAQLTRWFAERAIVQLKPGGSYRFWGKHTLGAPGEAEARQSISRLEPGRLLAFTWPIYGVDTEVTLTVAAEAEGSQLTLHHHIKGDLGMPRERELIEDHWRLAFRNLAEHLAGGSGIILLDYADPAPEIRMVIRIEAGPEAVFRALIEPKLINQWFGTESAVVDPKPGGRYVLGWKYQVDGRDVEGGPTRILEIVPNQKLVLDWPDWRGDKTVTGQTISFFLQPVAGGTELTFVHAGFQRTADISDYPFGWDGFLGELVKVVTARAPA